MSEITQHPFWRNEFLDIVCFECNRIGLVRWNVYMDGKYIIAKGGLNQAKSFVNKTRGLKTKWIKIPHFDSY